MRNLRWLLFLLGVLLAALLCVRRPDAPVAASPRQRLVEGAKRVLVTPSAADSKNTLFDVRSAIRQMDAKEAVAWLTARLMSGEDADLRLDLTLDAGQNLAGWPSWRTFLLDMLYLTDPEAAAAISREVLGTSVSADEWAVALRNLARVGKDDDLLKTKAAELLRRKEWQKNPTAGYLEAFDVIVHTRNATLAAELLDHCDQRDEKAVRHASFLTLDRLIMAEPAKVLPDLAANASKHPQSGLMISNMIARADVRDAAQRQAVETYLLDPKRTADELRGFASVFPNANIAVSQNLLTKAPTIQGAELAVRDRAAHETVLRWLADSRFAKAHENLRQAEARLRSFIGRSPP